MTIPELKVIAAQYGVTLHPIALMSSHMLEYEGNKGRYEDKKLEAMTEAEFRAICDKAVTPTEIDPDTAAQWRTAEREHWQPRRRWGGRYDRKEKVR